MRGTRKLRDSNEMFGEGRKRKEGIMMITMFGCMHKIFLLFSCSGARMGLKNVCSSLINDPIMTEFMIAVGA
jgi:hypothetical protein